MAGKRPWGERNRIGGKCCFCRHESRRERFYLIEPHGWACTGENSCADAFFESRRARRNEWVPVGRTRAKESGRPSHELEKEHGYVT